MIKMGQYDSNSSRWQAVVDRDKAAEGCFYYAVVTTGIFCRPGCSSRLPNQGNVEYFETGAEAMRAGFRPCKRCNPTGETKDKEVEQKIVDVCRKIENSDKTIKLDTLAREAGLSSFHFHRLFKKIVGVTPKMYSSNHQSLRFREKLKSSKSITDAIFDAGYSSTSGAYSSKGDLLAMKPKEYRAGGRGVTIQYGVAECILGWVIVAATDRGICGIEFGDDVTVLVPQLQKRFPEAVLKEAGPGFKHVIEDVVQFVKVPTASFNLPLDIQGTVFQQKVWTILREIEPGKTMSYTEVAEKVGNPKAVRAVATACASNKIAVVIPCHRVISKAGKISGYRWGVTRKNDLLENEKKRS
jgi:AraC family transcriptional regulator, regulatory protein of adaptative response / methylated-DNA-[protein]-cysteine methyltransferase